MNTDILIINGSPRKNKNCFKISEEISRPLFNLTFFTSKNPKSEKFLKSKPPEKSALQKELSAFRVENEISFSSPEKS